MSKSALSTFRAKEEEIEKKKMEVKEKVQAQLGRIEEETKRLATIREVLFSFPAFNKVWNKNLEFFLFALCMVKRFFLVLVFAVYVVNLSWVLLERRGN